MELKGKITQVLPEKTGTSARGAWRKQEYVIELPGDYQKQVCFMVWGDKIDQFQIEQGQELTVKGETSGGITRLEVFADSVRCQIIDFEISLFSPIFRIPIALHGGLS